MIWILYGFALIAYFKGKTKLAWQILLWSTAVAAALLFMAQRKAAASENDWSKWLSF